MIKQDYKPTVSAVVLNDNGQILVTHNKSHGADFWKLPQGGVEEGETLEAAILREMKEELNSTSFEILEKSDIDYRYDWPQPVQERKGFIGPKLTFFILKCTDVSSLKPDEEELDAVKWLNVDEFVSSFAKLPEFVSTASKLRTEIEELASK